MFGFKLAAERKVSFERDGLDASKACHLRGEMRAAVLQGVRPPLALMWTDLDFEDLVMYVRRAYVWGRFKVPKSKASKSAVPMHPLLAGFLLAWRDKTPFAKDTDFVFPSIRLKGKSHCQHPSWCRSTCGRQQ